MGKLIVIEGLDGSGKATQARLLANCLKEAGNIVREVSFPDYDSESSALVKMYLAGQFGTHPDDVNAYAASSFYAVDRYASYKKTGRKSTETVSLLRIGIRHPMQFINAANFFRTNGTHFLDGFSILNTGCWGYRLQI